MSRIMLVDDAWTSVGRAGFILDNLIASGKARPMIVVMPAGHQPATVAAGAPAAPGAGSFGAACRQPVHARVRGRRGALRGAPLPHDSRSGAPRDCRPVDGRTSASGWGPKRPMPRNAGFSTPARPWSRWTRTGTEPGTFSRSFPPSAVSPATRPRTKGARSALRRAWWWTGSSRAAPSIRWSGRSSEIWAGPRARSVRCPRPSRPSRSSPTCSRSTRRSRRPRAGAAEGAGCGTSSQERVSMATGLEQPPHQRRHGGFGAQDARTQIQRPKAGT